MPPSLVARYTYRLHVQASILEGLFAGLIVTNDVVMQKSLGATQWQLVLLTMAPNLLYLVSPITAHHAYRIDRFRLFLAAGLLGRLGLLAMAFLDGPWPYLGLFSMQSLMQSFLIPAQNALYQQNYTPSVRGRLYGRASMYGTLAGGLAALISGLVFDQDKDAYRWLYPIAGVVGLASCIAYGRIRLRRAETPADAAAPPTPPEESGPLGPSLLGVLRETLVRDAGFRRFEIGILIYGLGFMCIQPVFARLFDQELHMNYSDASLAKGVVTNLAMIASIGWAGRVLHKIGLERLAMLSYVTLLGFAGLMVFAATSAQAVTLFALYGVGMAGVSIVWTMGPVHFAPPGASARYMGVHLALVGVRALIGNALGGFVAEVFGSSRPTFALAAAFFGTAALLMSRACRMAGAGGTGEPSHS
jgi:MFS family permease